MKTIKNKTYANFMFVAKWVMQEKGYDEKTAYQIAHNLFETLEANPQGNIWAWAKMLRHANEE